MDRPFDSLDRHFQLPEVSRGLPLDRPLRWLRSAWDDLRYSPSESLTYGLVFTLAGWLILAFAAGKPYLFSAAISSFLLLAPLLLSGLYEISRRRDQGQDETTLADSLQGYRRNGQSLFLMGVLLAVVAIGWERISAILFALLYGGAAPDLGQFARDIFLSGEYLHLALTWTLLGGILAAVVFGITAVSVPMLVDRDVDAITAMMTSLRAVAANLLPMLLWAGLIVALTAVGFATLLVGLIVILPLLGHATWHAYKDLVH
jgi:uncharacterized membrane protein